MALFRDIEFNQLRPRRIRADRFEVSTTENSFATALAPSALSFGKTTQHWCPLAVGSEDGFVTIVYMDRWPCILRRVVHSDTVCALEWSHLDQRIYTGSADLTIVSSDAETGQFLRTVAWHTRGVKALSVHPSNPDCLLSGARDGNVALWDLRSWSTVPSLHITKPHLPRTGASITVTVVSAVLLVGDGEQFVTAGATDKVLKLWDVRQLKENVEQYRPGREGSLSDFLGDHGYTSLSRDSSGVNFIASAKGPPAKIFLFSMFSRAFCPTQEFEGHETRTHYVKAALSPDGTNVLSGSSTGKVHLWPVNNPQDGRVLQGHEEQFEATLVDWCPTERFKFATASDDRTVRTWNVTSLNTLGCHHADAWRLKKPKTVEHKDNCETPPPSSSVKKSTAVERPLHYWYPVIPRTWIPCHLPFI